MHASFQQLAEEQGKTYLGVTADVMTKQNMYLGFQEQQHVDMLKFREQNKQAYALQATQLEIGIEQMKMSGMENLANWIIETPTFSMDIAPLVTMMGDLAQTQMATETAYDLANPQPQPLGSSGAYSGLAQVDQRSKINRAKQKRTQSLGY
ncbi:hypothetical protein LCGC14_3073730 [marine sediment metagenome]|uniref:Uncharacterized protein n=1 Tax=marine sediment metagenome TaxID=412755 RepID=A0A0F8Z608_9ZZZZ